MALLPQQLIDNPRLAAPPRDDSFEEWRRYLWHLGHGLSPEFPSMEADGDKGDNWRAFKGRVTSPDDTRFQWMVASYQSYNYDIRGERSPHGFTNLLEDGRLGMFTAASVKTRVCFHRDRSPHPFGNGQPKWVTTEQNPVVIVWLGPDTLSMNRDSYNAAGMGFPQICGLHIRSGSNGEQDIFANATYIDGESNVLADSFSPDRNQTVRSRGGRRTLRQRYDSGDTRIYAQIAAFITIAFHELEHAVHFDGHIAISQAPNQIINPMYVGPRFALRNGVWVVDAGDLETRYLRLAYPGSGTPPGPGPGPGPGGPDTFNFYISGRRNNGPLVHLDDPVVFEGI